MYEPKFKGKQMAALNDAISSVLVISSPLFCFFYYIAYSDFGSSLSAAITQGFSEGPVHFFYRHLPRPSVPGIQAYLLWVLLQAVLYACLPGPIHYGPRTCGGRRLPYKLNGLLAWIITVSTAAVASYRGYVDPALIAKHWGDWLVAASIYSLSLMAVFYVKARICPDNEGETLITESMWYNILNGGELHPRTGLMFDWKHFNASRTGGILFWTLIDLSFASWQYQMHHTVTKTMIATVLLRAIVVVDYFLYEDWFFETLDGSHERFAFYSAYGMAVLMPLLWTLQSQYLAQHPLEQSWSLIALSCGLFALGFILNHDANGQKAQARRTAGNLTVWGQPAQFIKAQYHTTDGKLHHTVLLCSGWWGVVRHANYVGSALYAWASCILCGTRHLFPYMEAILVTGIVIHRCWRDEARCRAKYGKAWDEYCARVKWRMIPGIY